MSGAAQAASITTPALSAVAATVGTLGVATSASIASLSVTGLARALGGLTTPSLTASAFSTGGITVSGTLTAAGVQVSSLSSSGAVTAAYGVTATSLTIGDTTIDSDIAAFGGAATINGLAAASSLSVTGTTHTTGLLVASGGVTTPGLTVGSAMSAANVTVGTLSATSSVNAATLVAGAVTTPSLSVSGLGHLSAASIGSNLTVSATAQAATVTATSVVRAPSASFTSLTVTELYITNGTATPLSETSAPSFTTAHLNVTGEADVATLRATTATIDTLTVPLSLSAPNMHTATLNATSLIVDGGFYLASTGDANADLGILNPEGVELVHFDRGDNNVGINAALWTEMVHVGAGIQVYGANGIDAGSGGITTTGAVTARGTLAVDTGTSTNNRRAELVAWDNSTAWQVAGGTLGSSTVTLLECEGYGTNHDSFYCVSDARMDFPNGIDMGNQLAFNSGENQFRILFDNTPSITLEHTNGSQPYWSANHATGVLSVGSPHGLRVTNDLVAVNNRYILDQSSAGAITEYVYHETYYMVRESIKGCPEGASCESVLSFPITGTGSITAGLGISAPSLSASGGITAASLSTGSLSTGSTTVTGDLTVTGTLYSTLALRGSCYANSQELTWVTHPEHPGLAGCGGGGVQWVWYGDDVCTGLTAHSLPLAITAGARARRLLARFTSTTVGTGSSNCAVHQGTWPRRSL